MLPPGQVTYGKIEGVVNQPLEALPEGVEYPHQLDGSSAEDGPPSRLEFETLKMRVEALTESISRLTSQLVKSGFLPTGQQAIWTKPETQIASCIIEDAADRLMLGKQE